MTYEKPLVRSSYSRKKLKLKGTYVVVQLLSRVQLFATPWIPAYHASLSFRISRSLLKFTSIELVMLSNHLVPLLPLFLLPSIFPSIRAFSTAFPFTPGGQELKLQLEHQSFQ